MRYSYYKSHKTDLSMAKIKLKKFYPKELKKRLLARSSQKLNLDFKNRVNSKLH